MQRPASLTLAIVDRELSENQLAELGLSPGRGSVHLGWLARHPMAERVGVHRLSGSTVLLEGGGNHLLDLFETEQIDLPGIWWIGTDMGVWAELRVFVQGRLVRHLQDDSPDLLDVGEPLGDESSFRILDEDGELDGLDGGQLLAELPRLAGALDRHPDFDVMRADAERLSRRGAQQAATNTAAGTPASAGFFARLLGR